MATSPLGSSPFTALGSFLHPASAFRRRSQPEIELQHRVGVLGLFCIATGLGAMAVAVGLLLWGGHAPTGAEQSLEPGALEGALVLVAVSVFAPQAIFRTRNAALTREVLSNPSTPIRPWRSTTITFDAVLVGAMLAGLYFDPAVAMAFFGLALVLRVVFQSTRNITSDPNARYHSLLIAWTSAASGAAAYAIVAPLSLAVTTQHSFLPLAFAGLVAMYIGLVFNSVERWVNGDRTKWAFARDAVDLRRIVVALVSAGIAYLVSEVGQWIGSMEYDNPVTTATLAGLAIFVASWLLLWFVSIRLWRRDALRTLALWGAHQAEVVGRLADGSLSPDLAARAALSITTRMAVSIFGATRALAVLVDNDGHSTTHLAAVDFYDNAPTPDPRALARLPHLRMPLYPVPGHPNGSMVTVAGWLWTGWFMTRAESIVNPFIELATNTMLTPVIASDDDRRATAFSTMFDNVNRAPTLAAFNEAVDRMRGRADLSPHTESLLVGVYSIDEFGALAGGKFEQVAVSQVMRLAMGHKDFAGHDLFVAYEAPGRLWIALTGGPIIRNGIALLRGLQQHINDHGAVPSARLDVDVHISVSFGYAAHQVDDFTTEGLMATALNRLAIDQSSRDPFMVDDLITLDFRPEDITGEAETPLTALDITDLLLADAGDPANFTRAITPIAHPDSGDTEAVMAAIGWERSFGSHDLSDPAAFQTIANRQLQLAAAAARVILKEVQQVLQDADEIGRTSLPVLVQMPSILLSPESGDLAMPNLIAAALDRRQCSRTVLLVDTVPHGGGQALRLLSDRGVHVAVTAAAAAGAEPTDLYGWQRWGIVFPNNVVQGPAGVDSLTIQQTASAIATRTTRLIGIADQWADQRELADNNITLVMDPNHQYGSVRESVDSPA